MFNTIETLSEWLVVAPAMHKFPELPTIAGTQYGTWSWHQFDALDYAVTTKFREQGYSGVARRHNANYYSLASYLLVSEQMKQFTWLILDRRGKCGTLFSMPNADECPFDDGSRIFSDDRPYYVSAGWGNSVLKLAELGICRIEKFALRWRGVHWSGRSINLPAEGSLKPKLLLD